MSVVSVSNAVSDSVVKSAGADKGASALLSPSFPSLRTIKDQRAYEHNRQRVKKAADVFKMRQKKKSGPPPPKLDRGTASEKDRRLRADDVDPLDGILVESARRDDTPPLPRSSEVKLSDLIVRKQDTKKDSDFEVIPHVRSVIVLDDFTPDLAADEPWEYIYGESDDEGEVAHKPSYAQVLLSN
ncbi:uncharacterized protein BT62DRAFT_267413 [Guyanagaster necrorhizus]|uniref:Uncharacterized protein n=1 Tax=Guyanagaster necrorhizus TaxID=856835 RepID=A0A9P8AZC9_9AGAR|nr:uncharacterized protein BT62DRAFT_267413 [Guyanagaster necrorhizus MCA 3950]KAG7451837.1 hypothetical protein BT62DRAFT_267413 [Guyanagaster necrorhizus MCA 3950]